MKKNLGIKALSMVVVGVVALVLINKRHYDKSSTDQAHDPNNFNAAIARQFNDNIRDVSARLLETQKKLQTLEKQHKAPTSTLTIPSDITDAIAALKEELSGLKETHDKPDYTVEAPARASQNRVRDIDALLMQRTLSPQEKNYWETLNNRHLPIKPQRLPKVANETTSTPYYTIPAGSDLSNTTLLSALIGEVPNEGKLMQPLFPFTALISSKDLMASNGVPLPPDISGMKVNGYAIGVGSFLDNISCVRAYVTSALFTFQDGHFVTVGNEDMKNTTDLVNNESLGYLTTSFGNPCIHGKYHTNAPRVLGVMLAAGGVQGLGSALSQWQMTSVAGATGITQAPTGSFGRLAMGSAVSEGSVKTADWLEKRVQGSFDMVFVPASIETCAGHRCRYHTSHLSLHITKTINLDKETNGRVLDYGRLYSQIHDTSLR